MGQRNIRWLLGELDSLVRDGVLEESAAGRLRHHYEALEEPPKQLRELFFVVLGALLIGGGVILLLAHNWSELSRPVRTIIAFLPLVLMQGLAVFGVRTQRSSLAWREGVGIGLMMAVAVALALVGQTYHVPFNLGPFLLQWMLLILPVVYLFDATVPALVYLAGVISWSFSEGAAPSQAWVPWVLLLLVLPFLISRFKRMDRGRNQLLAWALVLTLPLVLGATYLSLSEELWPLVMALVFGWMWLEGEHLRGNTSWRLSPFSIVGGLGTVIMALVLSFGDDVATLGEASAAVRALLPAGWFVLVLAVALLSRWGWLLWAAQGRRRLATLALGLLPAVMVIPMIGNGPEDWLLALVMNLYLVAVGLLAMRDGFVRDSVGWANAGLAVISLLILVRFFDSDLPLVARGLAFVAVGVGFLLANRALNRRVGASLGGAE